ncbi:MAG: hypothetical protein IPP44_23095 [Ideonella sp.]|nr:hypothetical protein [Ideonella sp.]
MAAGMNPMDLKRGIDKAVIALVAVLKTLQGHHDQQGNRPGRHHLGQQR